MKAVITSAKGRLCFLPLSVCLFVCKVTQKKLRTDFDVILQNKGEVAGVILLLCVIHFL